MATIVHKLSTLHSLGQSLLVQLYNVRTYLNDSRVRPDIAKPEHAKIAKALTAKFPDPVALDKIAGLDGLIKAGGQVLSNEMEPHYYAFVDLVDFHDLALKAMNEVAKDVPELKIGVNPDLTELFLDLYVVFVQVVLLNTQLEERKLLLAFHAPLYASLKSGEKEPNAARVMNLMKEYGSGGEATLKKLWSVLAPMGRIVINALLEMQMSWITARSVTTLRNEGTLNISANPAKLTLPSSQPIYADLLRTARVNNWFYYGFLYSPEAIAGNDAATEALKFVIQDTFVGPIYRDFSLNLNKEWEELQSYKTKTASMSKAKKAFKDGFTEQAAHCAQTHRDRRIFVRHELYTLKCILSDTPALLAPKLPLVFAALAMAKDELAWFFRNKSVGSKQSKSHPALFEDPTIPELIHLTLSLQQLIRSAKDYIIDYHVQYIKGADTTRLDEMINESRFKSSTDADVQTVLGWMIGWLRTAEVGRHFGEVRHKWAEVQTVFISGVRTVPPPIIMPVVERVQLIMFHTKVVDSFDDLVAEHTSIRGLWYHRAEMQTLFERAIVDGSPALTLVENAPNAQAPGAAAPGAVAEGSSGAAGAEGGSVAGIDATSTSVVYSNNLQAANALLQSPQANQYALHCLTFLPFASQAVENATQYDPFEKDRIGQDAVVSSLSVVNKIVEAAAKDLEIVSGYFVEFELQLEGGKSVDAFANKLNELMAGAAQAQESSAKDALTAAQQPGSGADAARLAQLQQALQQATATAKRASEKVPLDVIWPGSESTFSSRSGLASLRANYRHLWQLLSAIDEFGSILVYNTLITPREYLVSRIKKLFKSFLERYRYLPADKAPFKDDQTITPPSQLVHLIRAYANFIKSLDMYITIDTDLLVNQVLLKQVYSTSIGVSGGKLEWMSDKGFEYSDNVIKVVAKWYGDFFARRITNPAVNVVYSANRRGFVSKSVANSGAPPSGSSSNSVFKAEKYLDLVELTKLTSIIGPYGVKIIDREILRFVVSNMSTLLGTLRTLRADLTELSNSYVQEATTNQVLKTLKPVDLDSFIASSIVVGNALTFRRLLYRSLGITARRTIPHLHNVVSNSFHQYLRNTFGAVEFVGMDSMAQDAGVDVSIADQPLKAALAPLVASDRALWDLLPAAFAASFLISTHWKEAIYNPLLEAYENNVHVLAHTISDLLINFQALSNERAADENTIREHLVKFLDISGTILLRALSSPKLDPKLVPREFSSLFVFLDLFVQQCPLLSRAELEPILPYSILRSMWRSIYSKAAKGKADELDL